MRLHAGRFTLASDAAKLTLIGGRGARIVLTLAPATLGKLRRALFPTETAKCKSCRKVFERERRPLGRLRLYCGDLCRGDYNRAKRKRTRAGR